MKFFKKKSETGKAEDTKLESTGRFSKKRIIIGIVSVLVLLWVISTVVGLFGSSDNAHLAKNEKIGRTAESASHEKPESAHSPAHEGKSKTASSSSHDSHGGSSSHSSASSHDTHGAKSQQTDSSGHGASSHSTSTAGHNAPEAQDKHGKTSQSPAASSHDSAAHSTDDAHGKAAQNIHAPGKLPKQMHLPGEEVHKNPGVALTKAIIEPLRKELEDRWWGWRPNDLINITDNVNNYQLGVLEVTRRAAVALADRLARTGSTAAYDPNLEDAMNWFMVKANAYWFPSPESKYKEGLRELEAYKRKLENGQGTFFTRADNLIPMLMTFEDLLGSCDENLAKAYEDDGSEVSFFKADDYFYYSKGVASSMHGILEAIHEDFHTMLENRRASEVLHHAILSCHHAADIDPWLILNSDLGSIFANHRANMAAPISHARFYLGLLIKALST